MNLVKGDTVIVIAGRDKGKTGVIQKVIPESNRVVVENVNLRKKHKKPTQQNPDGGIVEIYAPIGLDIGGESLNEIAISVVAEMMAVKNNRDGGFSRDKKRHDMFPGII